MNSPSHNKNSLSGRQVARMRGLPIFTFVNKMDRPSLNGFEIIEQLDQEFGLAAHPLTWPIGSGGWMPGG